MICKFVPSYPELKIDPKGKEPLVGIFSLAVRDHANRAFFVISTIGRLVFLAQALMNILQNSKGGAWTPYGLMQGGRL
jgi:hypothetical protein